MCLRCGVTTCCCWRLGSAVRQLQDYLAEPASTEPSAWSGRTGDGRAASCCLHRVVVGCRIQEVVKTAHGCYICYLHPPIASSTDDRRSVVSTSLDYASACCLVQWGSAYDSLAAGGSAHRRAPSRCSRRAAWTDRVLLDELAPPGLSVMVLVPSVRNANATSLRRDDFELGCHSMNSGRLQTRRVWRWPHGPGSSRAPGRAAPGR